MLRTTAAVLALALAAPALAQSNVSPNHTAAWGENIGWINFRSASGARLLSNHLAGHVWGENVGWISLGQGTGPYDNADGATSGVNYDASTGLLSGLAWGENIGWINFSTSASLGADGARVESNRLRGWAWGENVGWINLDDMDAFVGFCVGDQDGDGQVGASDLAVILGSWGTNSPAADLNVDGVVNAADLAALLGSWGPCQ